MPTAVVVSVHESVMPCIRSIRVWDLRMLSKAPVQVPPPPWLFSSPTKQALISAQVLGHGYGVKRLRWSAHAANHLLSCSYDTTVPARLSGQLCSIQALPCNDIEFAGSIVGNWRLCGRTQLLAASHGVCDGHRLGSVRPGPRGELRVGQQVRVVGCWGVTCAEGKQTSSFY